MKVSKIQQSHLGFTKAILTFKYENEIHVPDTVSQKMVYADALLAGAAGLKREEFLEKLKSLGSKISVSANNEFVTISVISLDNKLSQTLQIVKAILEKPNFEQKEIKRIRELTINQLRLLNEDARYQTDRFFSAELFKKTDTRYQFSNEQLLKTIPLVTKTHLTRTHKNTLASEWNLTVAGSSKSNSFTRKFFASLYKKHTSAQDFPTNEKDSRTVTKNTTKFIDLPGKQNIEFNIGSSLNLKYTDEDYPAFLLGISVLGLLGGFAGRLMSTVREKEGLTYGIYAQIEHLSKTETGYWKIKTFFSPDDALQGLASTKREIRKIVQRGITENELSRFKKILHTREILQADSLSNRIKQSHSLLIHNISKKEHGEFKEKLQNLQRKQVNNALKKYINIEKLVITAVGPVKNVGKEIQKFNE